MASGTITGYCTNDRTEQPEFYCDWVSTPINSTQSTLTLHWRVYKANNNWYPYDYSASDNFTYSISTNNSANGTFTVSTRIKFNTNGNQDNWQYYLKDTHPANATEATYAWCGNYTGKQGYTFRTDVLSPLTHNSDGTLIVTINSVDVKVKSSTLQHALIDGTISEANRQMVLDPLVSACTAPTSVSVSSAIIAPGSVTVSWSGASAGNNNAISKYRLFYKTGSAPTISSYTGYFDTTSTSYAPTILTSRGTTYYFKVQTIGSVSGYDSGISSAQVTCLVNVQPDSPTLNKSSQTIASTSSGVSVTATAGAMNAGSSTSSVYYATSTSGNKSKYTSAITINPSAGNSSSYYFWTYDGLEYSSSYASITITKNTKPTISASTFTPAGYLAQNTAADTNTYVSSVTAAATCDRSCTINIQLLYGTSSSPSNTLNQTDKSGSTSSTSLGTYNINSLLKSYYTGDRLYFRLRIRATDSYESGDWVYSNVWSIAAAPTTQATYDRFNTSNLVDTTHCWDKIRIVYYEDGSMTQRSVSATSNGTSITASISATSTSDKYRYLDVTLPQTLASNATVIVTVTITDNNISKTFTATRTELPLPSLGTLGISLSTINIYTTTSDIQLTCTAPCAFSNSQPTTAADYYITTCTINKASNTDGANATNLTATIEANAAGNTLTATITKANFVSFGDFNVTSYKGTVTGYVQIVFTNKYGRSFSTGYKSYTINYNEDATVSSVTIQYSTNNSTWTALGSNSIQEGLYLRASVVCSAYTNSTLTAKLYYKIGSGSYILVNSNTATVSNGTNAQSKTIIINFGQLPEITTSDSWTWKVNLTSTATSTTSTTTATTTVIKHIAPTLTLNSLSATKTPSSGTRTGANFTYSITLNTNYSNITNTSTSTTPYTTRTYTLYTTSNTATSANFTTTSGTIADSGTDKASWGQKSIKVYCITTVVGLTTTTKTAYSNILTAYFEQPTVAYRTNLLGINTDTPDTDTVLDIRSAENKEVIRLGNTTGGGKIEMGIVSGSIYIDII